MWLLRITELLSLGRYAAPKNDAGNTLAQKQCNLKAQLLRGQCTTQVLLRATCLSSRR